MADPWANFMMKTHCSWRKPCNCLVWVVGLTFHSVNKFFAGNIGNQGSFHSTSRWSTVDLQNLQIFRRAKWTFHFEFKFHASCKISKNGSPSSSSISPISPCFFFAKFLPIRWLLATLRLRRWLQPLDTQEIHLLLHYRYSDATNM